jgi:hypothetical protein
MTVAGENWSTYSENVSSLPLCSPYGLAWEQTRASTATGQDCAGNSKYFKIIMSRLAAITNGTNLKRVPQKQQCDVVFGLQRCPYSLRHPGSLVRSYLIWRRCRELQTCWRSHKWITLQCLLSVCALLNLRSLCHIIGVLSLNFMFIV